MEFIIDGIKYYKVKSLVIGKYEFLLLIKGNSLYYVIDDNGTYKFPNPDVSLKGNANISLSNVNSRIIMEHITKTLEHDMASGVITSKEMLEMKISQIQRILNNSDMYNMIKGNINELYHYDDEVNKMLEKFNELYLSLSGIIPHVKENVKVKKPKVLKEDANVDTIMLIMLANIGILLFVMFILSVLR